MRRLLVYKILRQYEDFLNPPSRWLAFSLLAEAVLRESNGAVAAAFAKIDVKFFLLTA